MDTPSENNPEQVGSASATTPSGFGVASRADALVATGGLPQPAGASLAASGSSRPSILYTPPKPFDLVKALQRRWLLGLCLAIVAALPPAIIAWFLVPLNYTATSWLRVRRGPAFLFTTKTEQDVSPVQEHIALIKGPFVASAALRRPGISGLDWVKEQRARGIDEADWLAKKISVSIPRGTHLLTIKMSGDEPNQLQKLVNAVTEAYLNQVVNTERRDLLSRRDRLEQQHIKKGGEIHLLRERTHELEKEIGTGDEKTASTKKKILMDIVIELRKELGALRGEFARKRREIALHKKQYNLENEDEDGKTAIPVEVIDGYIAQDEDSVRLLIQLQASEAQHKRFVVIVKDPANSKAVQLIEKQIREIRKAIDTRRKELRKEVEELVEKGVLMPAPIAKLQDLESELQTLTDAQKEVGRLFEDNSLDLQDLSRYSADLERYNDELGSLKMVSDEMGFELAKLELELSGEGARVVSLRKADKPNNADRNRRNRVAGLAALIGGGLALLVVSLLEFNQRRITTAEEMIDGLGVRVMGDVPMLSEKRWRIGGLWNGATNGALQGVMDESIDSIRAMLLHSAEGESVRVLMVSSAKSGEGKTTVASSLAASLGRSGRRTLLIDGDLRRPSVHRLLELPLDTGFAEVLRGEAAVEEVIRPSRATGLWVMSAGQCDHTTLQALTRDGVGQIFEKLRGEFDFIVVDSGPVLAVVDPLLLGQFCDAVVISVVRCVSQISSVYDTCERFKATGIRVLGCVVNGLSRSPFGFGYYGYGYGYGYARPPEPVEPKPETPA